MTTIIDSKARASKMLKQSKGTLEKVFEMIEHDAYCPNIIQQVDSVLGLIDRARLELLRGHLENCLQEKLKENKNKTIDELIKLYKLSS